MVNTLKKEKEKNSCEKIHLQFDWLDMFLTWLNDLFFFTQTCFQLKSDW